MASTTLSQPQWNATVIKGELAQSVNELKQQEGEGGLLVLGSGALERFLAGSPHIGQKGPHTFTS